MDGPTPAPVSERKLAANRANALRSTGPRTAAGKARSSRNALKHGQTASAFALLVTATEEERGHFESVMGELYQTYDPSNPTERMLFERLGVAYLRLLRSYAYERKDLIPKKFLMPEMTAWKSVLPEPPPRALPELVADLLPYESAIERTLIRTIRELRRLGVMTSRASQNEAIAKPRSRAAADGSHASFEIEDSA